MSLHDFAPQLNHYRHVNFDINYEETTNVEEYFCEDNEIREGNLHITHTYNQFNFSALCTFHITFSCVYLLEIATVVPREQVKKTAQKKRKKRAAKKTNINYIGIVF